MQLDRQCPRFTAIDPDEETSGGFEMSPGSLPGGWRLVQPLQSTIGNAVLTVNKGTLGVALLASPDATRDVRGAITEHQVACRDASGLRHPALPRVLDYGYDPLSDVLYLVAEHVDGASLASVRRRAGPLAPGVAASILLPIADALVLAHLRGVAHGRLTPDQVVVTASEASAPMLVGLGMIPDGGGPVIGIEFRTRDFQPREARSAAERDVWALAAIAYYLTEGRRSRGALITDDERHGVARLRVGGQAAWSRRLRQVLQSGSPGTMSGFRDMLMDTIVACPEEVERTAAVLSPRSGTGASAPGPSHTAARAAATGVAGLLAAFGIAALASTVA